MVYKWFEQILDSIDNLKNSISCSKYMGYTFFYGHDRKMSIPLDTIHLQF